YKEEIDSLLTFAGLFSAIVSVYGVDEYTSLTPTPTSEDIARLVLLQIYARSSNISADFGDMDLIKSASMSTTYSALSSSASFNAKVVNILWFSALMLALGAAAVVILVRQWLNFHQESSITTPSQSVRIWHFRHRGLVQWQVPHIITALPTLLQIAVALFLTGMVIKLWPLDQAVATVLAAQLVALWAFFLITTITPLIYTSCPYKSPQA
ncbi:hypothetical protein WOLCODRAFT_56436, partial [Wolfiporia cocos MD-104 SS10]